MREAERETGAERAVPTVLAVDDDPSVLGSVERILTRGLEGGVRFVGAEGPTEALELLRDLRPDVILLDVLMPEMSGYELCAAIQEREELAYVPVVFVTVLDEAEDRARAFAAGATEFVEKPFEVGRLLKTVRSCLEKGRRWRSLSPATEEGEEGEESPSVLDPRSWSRFKRYLEDHLEPGPEARDVVENAEPGELYALAEPLGLTERELSRYAADFFHFPAETGVVPEEVAGDALPSPFCKANLVVPLRTERGSAALLANPFDWELIDTLSRVFWSSDEMEIRVAEPEVIRAFFTYGEGGERKAVEEVAEEGDPTLDADRSPEDVEEEGATEEGHAVMALANELLRRAVSDRASDIHVEPKAESAVVRFRIDGDLTDVRRISRTNCRRLIARFKAIGQLDIAEKRKPQDGALEAVIRGERYKLRLATTHTPHGESLVIRLLEPFAEPPELEELGMTEEQGSALRSFADRSAGLLLFVGPTGSGKSTTVFGVLAGVDGHRRSIITVEDPVEYRIPNANQQQVRERAGATFENLLRSAVRQDPDILLLGEIRDLFSAKAALDFASSGHLTISTLHSANATTAIFRLERLGVERGEMADSILAVVAQKLLKTLCAECREVRPIRDEERDLLSPFTEEVPEEVAEPKGCPRCRGTGWRGREGIYEILAFDLDVARMVRKGASIAAIRGFVAERGDFLIGRHAVEKIRRLRFTPRQVYEQVLLEEVERKDAGAGDVAEGDEARAGSQARAEPEGDRDAEWIGAEASGGESSSASAEEGDRSPRVLVVEDDETTRLMLERALEEGGYTAELTGDGVEALLKLGRGSYDLILCDVHMPNLDGLRLLELMSQKGIEVPVIFLTGDPDDEAEVRGLELGAADFITKPVQKKVLRARIQNVLGGGGTSPAESE